MSTLVHTAGSSAQDSYLFRTIFEATATGIAVVTDTGIVRQANPALATMLGYSVHELVGDTFARMTFPEDKGVVSRRIAKFRKNRRTFRFEKRFRHSSGRGVWCRVTVSALKTTVGEAMHVSMFDDITEQKIADEALAASESRLAAILNSDFLGICSWRMSGEILEANDAFLSIVGYTRHELAAGRLNWISMTPKEYEDRHRIRTKELLESGKFRTFEKEYLRKDGTRAAVLVGGSYVDLSRDLGVAYVLDITESKKMHAEALRLARIVESTSDAIISIALTGTIQTWNHAAEQLFGFHSTEAVGKSAAMLALPEQEYQFNALMSAAAAGISTENLELKLRTRHGVAVPVALTMSPIRDGKGAVIALSTISRDLTQCKKAEDLETQIQQSQKLEAIGRLAGGVAHDFNNILMVVMSYAQMLQRRLPAGDRMHSYSEQILKAADRGASLSHQLLAFSRKQIVSPACLDLNTVTSDTSKMLHRLLGEDIEIRVKPNSSWMVEIDAGQVVQVLLNLCVNARDAMPNGGKLVVETDDVSFDPGDLPIGPHTTTGDYVLLAVTDTGCGMSREIQNKMFEPFFTTKEIGKGTGLGLSTVYGIVKQSSGFIRVESAVGSGTTLRIYLPAKRQTPSSAKADADAVVPGSERILLVEDEKPLRASVAEFLRENGYQVLEASNGVEALNVTAHNATQIDLLLTDVIMPEMGGQELRERLLTIRPDLKVLFMSGYSQTPNASNSLEGHNNVLQKPFALRTLSKRIREILAKA